MIVKLLTKHHLEFLSFKGVYTDSSESILVKTPHCRKSHVMAHIMWYCKFGNFREGFIFAKLRVCGVSRKYKLREMVKTICPLLMKVNHARFAIFLRDL